MCLLRSFESFDRGFYAGPFGWFSKHAADVAVAIRSSLVGANSVDLYAGVGIVPRINHDERVERAGSEDQPIHEPAEKLDPGAHHDVRERVDSGGPGDD